MMMLAGAGAGALPFAFCWNGLGVAPGRDNSTTFTARCIRRDTTILGVIAPFASANSVPALLCPLRKMLDVDPPARGGVGLGFIGLLGELWVHIRASDGEGRGDGIGCDEGEGSSSVGTGTARGPRSSDTGRVTIQMLS